MLRLLIFAAALAGPPAAAQVLQPIDPANPPRQRDLPPELKAFMDRALAEVARGASVTPTGEPEQLAHGAVALGAPLVFIPVRHSYTGVLRQAVEPRGIMRVSKPVPAGSPVFGLPMSSVRGSQLIWCAPGVGATPGRSLGQTVCFPEDPNPMPGHWLTKGRPPFRWVGATGWRLLPTKLQFNPSHSGNWASEVLVDQRPVDFGPMQLTYAVTRVRPAALTVEARVRGEGGDSKLASYELARQPDGSALLRLRERELLLVPSADGKTISIPADPAADASG